MNLHYKPGNRAVKTSISIFFAMLITHILNCSMPFYTVIEAILSIQPTMKGSKHVGIHRIIGTLIGSVFSFIPLQFSIRLPYYNNFLYIIIVPIIVFLLIYICNLLNIKDAITACIITFVVITFIHNTEITDTLSYVIERSYETVLGVIIGITVNKYILPYCPSQT